MVILHPVSDFLPCNPSEDDLTVDYWYQGYCPHTQTLLRLPRSRTAEAIAKGLMAELAQERRYNQEGKMYGILLVQTETGEKRVLKAFSGLLNGEENVTGWVPPLPGRECLILAETRTLARLEKIKHELLQLKNIPERQQYQILQASFEKRLQNLHQIHQQRRQQRQSKRQLLTDTLSGIALAEALEKLNNLSRQDSREKRKLKAEKDSILKPLKQIIKQADSQIQSLKLRRKVLSSHLQEKMREAYFFTNFSGKNLTLQQFGALPTGTGDCCAPKLLHYAATHQLIPIALAEFWWGSLSANKDKIAGNFYPACEQRCQPLMGFLLSGLPSQVNDQFLPILYQDQWLIVVDKPTGLLSVPGRYFHSQDCVIYRLNNTFPNEFLIAIHRLDKNTSGILIIARDHYTYQQLSKQFQQQEVKKVYEALLSKNILINKGIISLPLGANPETRPRQIVDWDKGKSSITHFRLLAADSAYPRYEFRPQTGRTHQIRVHALNGLASPILGDSLYGCQQETKRLHLHARETTIIHPHLGHSLNFYSVTPF